MNPKPGDKVKVATEKDTFEGTEKSKISGTLQKQVFEGILMPNEETDAIVVKLDNGYNIGIDNKKIKKIDIIEKYKKTEKKAEKVKINKNKPTISILHTGGTIASKVDYSTGAVTASFKAEDLYEKFPELENIANIKSILISNLMSEDILFSDYQKIADAVKKEINKGVDGVIIGHGTDTLAVTSAALSFIFKNLPIPVLIVGSQRSSDRGSTDAAMNLICASEFIAKTDFAGVAICMHENTDDNKCVILPATKTRKLHTSRRDAFKAVNDTPIATIDFDSRKIQFIKKDYNKKNKKKVSMKNKFEDKVAVLRTFNNMGPDFFEVLTKKRYKGLVLEATGIGQAPTNIKENLPNYEALKKFISNGGVVALTSQCIFGKVHRDIYTNCRRLADIGVIFGEDMLTDTAYVKLAWLLGNYPKEKVKELIKQNLRGEINERILTDEFLEE